MSSKILVKLPKFYFNTCKHPKWHFLESAEGTNQFKNLFGVFTFVINPSIKPLNFSLNTNVQGPQEL